MEDVTKTLKPGLTMVILGLIVQAVAALIVPKPSIESALSGAGGGDTAKVIITAAMASLAMVCLAVGVGQMLIAYWHSSRSSG